MDVRIRDANPEDWDEIRKISGISGYMDYIGRIGPSYMDWGKVIVAEEAGILGFLKIEELPDKSAWLSGLRVDPARRREGIARLLTDWSVEFAGRNGLKSVRMIIHSDNGPSLKLVEKCGFRKALEYDFYEGEIDLTGYSRTSEVVYEPVFNLWKVMISSKESQVKNDLFVNGDRRIFLSKSDHSTFYQILSGNGFETREGEGIVIVEKGKGITLDLKRMEDFDTGLVYEKKTASKKD